MNATRFRGIDQFQEPFWFDSCLVSIELHLKAIRTGKCGEFMLAVHKRSGRCRSNGRDMIGVLQLLAVRHLPPAS